MSRKMYSEGDLVKITNESNKKPGIPAKFANRYLAPNLVIKVDGTTLYTL
jgi:hypothetical protein